MSKYGDGVSEPHAFSGSVYFYLDETYEKPGTVGLRPDEARLLGLRLIKMADEAEGQEW